MNCDLAQELVRMAETDLDVRERLAESGALFDGYHREMRRVHQRNGARLAEVLDQLGGWPGHGLVGPEGSEAAFLIAQHDIGNPELMRRACGLYASAVAQDDADPRRLPYLRDRILAFEGRWQSYGTQLGWDSEGAFGAWPPIADADTVDARRAEFGLPALADALRASREPDRPAGEVRVEHAAADQFAEEVGWR